MINFRFIAHLMGRLLLIETGFLLICLCVALFYQEPDWTAFAYTAGITLLASLAITTFVKPRDRILAKKDGYFTVTLVWIIFSLFGSLPYILGGTLPRFTDAFFETISGFTTTGASVITNVEIVPHATLFWRSLTHWLGGLGIIMLFLAILPSLGIEGRDLYVAETTGPVHSKTSFTFTGTARKLWVIYVALTALLTVLLCLGKMGLFDSICHAMSTMSSGGFSTKNTSVGYWDSPYIHYVLILFMFIAGTNFGLVYAAIKGQWRSKEPSGVLHRMAISPDYRGQGLGGVLLRECERICQEKGVTYLRADTSPDNTRMQHVFEKEGYVRCGFVELRGSDKIAYDKLFG